jgi:hypothetical protein
MSIAVGTYIGPYEVVRLIGAGGMGEVYRAHDHRLNRAVAIKVVPAHFATDRERQQRFEHEARAAAAVSDPNIVAIYDVGTYEGQPYLVSELLEGRDLRAILNEGPVPLRKAVDMAQQVSRGIAAAHRRGVVHRDLKPENLFATRDGHIKILDFGLAKLVEGLGTSRDGSTTAVGVVLGTVGYMSPEQARGQAADHRSDIFSFGSVVYELLTGGRAFRGDSSVEVLSAIIKEEPPDLLGVVPTLPPALIRIVERCLQKNPDERFQSAADLRFALEDSLGTGSFTPLAVRTTARWRWAAAAMAVAAVAAAVVVMASLRSSSQPAFEQLTFRRGTIHTARFASDGTTIVYAAAWEGKPYELFTTRPDSREARQLNMTNTGLFAVSRNDDMALALGARGFGRVDGTLARAPLAGGVPRELSDDVLAADWSPDGSELAIVKSGTGADWLEYPVGKKIYDPAPGHITHIRIDPSGNAIAAIVHPVSGDTAGDVVVVDRNGSARTLSSGWNSVLGIGWSPDGNEVWFTATRTGSAQALHAVSLDGRERLLLSAPATLTLHDVAPDGRALISRDSWGAGVIAATVDTARERDLSWLDGTTAWDISDDGKALVLEEAWEGGGTARSIFLRPTDGAAAVQLGDGVPLALSHDRQWVISTPVASDRLILLPTGTGQSRTLPPGNVVSYFPAARWLPGDRAVLFSGSPAGGGQRVYLQSIDSGDPRPVTAAGEYGRLAIFPDGRRFVTRGTERRLRVFSLADGSSTAIAGAQPRDLPIVVSQDGTWLYVQAENDAAAQIARVHLRSGVREAVRTLVPADPAGITTILRVVMTPDAKASAYTYVRALSSLYLVEGLR